MDGALIVGVVLAAVVLAAILVSRKGRLKTRFTLPFGAKAEIESDNRPAPGVDAEGIKAGGSVKVVDETLRGVKAKDVHAAADVEVTSREARGPDPKA